MTQKLLTVFLCFFPASQDDLDDSELNLSGKAMERDDWDGEELLGVDNTIGPPSRYFLSLSH